MLPCVLKEGWIDAGRWKREDVIRKKDDDLYQR
jgi:hypothetical protein